MSEATWNVQEGERKRETSAGLFVDVFFRKTNPAHLERYVAWLVVRAVRRIKPFERRAQETLKSQPRVSCLGALFHGEARTRACIFKAIASRRLYA